MRGAQRNPLRLGRTLSIAIITTGLAVLLACSKKGEPSQPYGGGGGGGTTTEPFDSGIFSSSSPVNVFVHTFNTPGDYAYHCRVHGTAMSGTVHVAAALPDSTIVTISNNSYSPPSVNVKTGGYVKWANNGSSHSVTRP